MTACLFRRGDGHKTGLSALPTADVAATGAMHSQELPGLFSRVKFDLDQCCSLQTQSEFMNIPAERDDARGLLDCRTSLVCDGGFGRSREQMAGKRTASRLGDRFPLRASQRHSIAGAYADDRVRR